MQKSSQNEDRFERLAVNAGEAAGMLGISTRTLWTRVSDGSIPTKRLGGRVLFPLDALRNMLDVDKQAPPID